MQTVHPGHLDIQERDLRAIGSGRLIADVVALNSNDPSEGGSESVLHRRTQAADALMRRN